jgi:hypothetical protein
MMTSHTTIAALPAALCLGVLLQACGSHSAPRQGQQHIRGKVHSLDGQQLTVATDDGSVQVQLGPQTLVATVTQSDRAHVAAGSFLGITSVRQPDGSERAVEIHVFPEAMRGTGQGSYAWDLPDADQGGSRMTNGTAVSRMTNGTVSHSTMTNGTVTSQEDGASLTLEYEDSGARQSQTITIPPDIPIVAIEPGRAADLAPGVHVFVVAHRAADGVLTADRALAGKDGINPPM